MLLLCWQMEMSMLSTRLSWHINAHKSTPTMTRSEYMEALALTLEQPFPIDYRLKRERELTG